MSKIPIYLINLDRSADRLASMQRQAKELGLEFRRICGVDGAADNSQPVMNHRYYRPLTPAEVGCYLSHIKTFREFLQTDCDHAIILEDDCVLSDNFPRLTQETMEKNREKNQWDALKLHGKKKGVIHSIAVADAHIVEHCTVPLATRGTIWTREGCRKMLSYYEQSGVSRPIDVDLRFTWETGLRILVLKPAVVQASDSVTTIADRRVLYYKQPRFTRVKTKLGYEASFVTKNFAHLAKRYGLSRALISQLGMDRSNNSAEAQ